MLQVAGGMYDICDFLMVDMVPLVECPPLRKRRRNLGEIALEQPNNTYIPKPYKQAGSGRPWLALWPQA